MTTTGLVMVLTLLAVPIYDFYILKKFKVKTTSCLHSAGITLALNFVIFVIGMLIGLAIFGNNNDYWVIVSLILVIGISYFRFKGREISKGEVKITKIKKEKILSPKDQRVGAIRSAASMGFFVVVVTAFLLFYLKTDNSADYYLRFIDPILIGLFALWTYKKLSFWGCLIMTTLFIIGKLIMFVPAYVAGGLGGAGIGMTAVISYIMIKGVLAAYRYNYS
jgi:phosphatidylglycerophosphate synthase